MSLVQTPDTQADPVSELTGSEDEAANAFEQRITPNQPTTEEAEPDGEPDDTTDEEASDGEPEDDGEATDELAEVEYEGKTYNVPPELQKALLRQADYSRKMNEVSAKEKVYSERMSAAEHYVQGAEKYAEVLAEVQSVDAQLKQFDAVNWQQLRADNPGEYAALAADMQTLRLSRDTAVRKAQGLKGEIEKAQQTSLNDKRNEMHKTLSKDLKGWGDELGEKIVKYALEKGYQQADLLTVTDPKWVIAMDKARRFDALQTAKTELKAKAKDAPAFVKPGAPRAKANPQADAMARLRKDNSTESAEAAFLQRFTK